MVKRKLSTLLRRRLAESPAVALLGPRQAGKTTLARSLGGRYFDLENADDRLALDLEWDALCKGDRLLVLDEAQVWPELFSRLRSAIDSRRGRNGRFLLLGSVSPMLMRHVSESLAGRLALLELTPFLVNEMASKPLETLWRVGGYPGGGILRQGNYPRWQNDYLTLLAQRDLPTWGLPAKPGVTARFLKMIAAMHGQLWNASQIGQSMGLSYHTVNEYLDYLQGAFLIRRLQPYHSSIPKRLIKSPKVYWRDSGLLHSQLNFRPRDKFTTRPWVGASWEGFVIEQAIGVLGQTGKPFEAFFLRTSDQREIDLLLDFGSRLWAIEIKLTSSPSPQDFGELNALADTIKADKRILISQTAKPVVTPKQVSCDLKRLVRLLEES